MIGGRPWTEEETAVLRHSYRAFGSNEVAARLAKRGYHRTPRAIQCRAKKLGLFFDQTQKGKLVPLVEVHSRLAGRKKCRMATEKIVAAAEADGVMVRGTAGRKERMAPEWWADQYIEKLGEEERRVQYLRAHWLTTAQVAELFGVAPRGAATCACKMHDPSTPLEVHLASIPSEVVMATHYGKRTTHSKTRFWEPTQARAAAAAYRALKARQRRNREDRHPVRRVPGHGPHQARAQRHERHPAPEGARA